MKRPTQVDMLPEPISAPREGPQESAVVHPAPTIVELSENGVVASANPARLNT